MKIIYTDSAKTELERFHQDRQKQLEAMIEHEKYVFGDEIVEITASDIRELEKRFYVKEERAYRFPTTTILLKMYFVVGIGMAVFGVFYDQFMELLTGNPIQRLLVLSGVGLSVLSIIGNYYLRVRQEMREHHEKRYREYEEKLQEKERNDC